MAQLSVRGVDRSFGTRGVLREVTFNAERGEAIALFGPSGCGKTTLLRILAGLEQIDGGEIVFDGRTFNAAHAFISPESRNLSMVFQGLALWPHMSVAKHLDFVLRESIRNRRDRAARVETVLSRFGLSELSGAKPFRLSGGEQQRLALARALVTEPPLLLLDEPFSHLDEAWRTRALEKLLERKHAGTVIVMATHNRDDLRELADQIITFSGEGTPVVSRKPTL